jgi:hypothetical protein
LIDAGPEWDEVLRLGWRHGVSLRLRHRLSEARIAVPTPVGQELDRRAQLSARASLTSLAELLGVLGDLERAGIDALPLKGPALAELTYANPSLREFIDLDVLVRPDDVDRAAEVLKSRGFHSREALDGGRKVAHGNAEYARHFQRNDMSIDLHWRFSRGYFASGIDGDECWRTARPANVQGHTIRSLSPEMTILGLCIHGGKHRPMPWAKLKWICDIDEILSGGNGPDWYRTMNMARRMGCTRMLHLGMALTEKLLGSPLPAEFARSVRQDRRANELADSVIEYLSRDRGGPDDLLSSMRLDLRLRERPREHVAYVVRRTLTPGKRDWHLVNLPRRLAFLYVPLRILRLFRQYSAACLHWIRKRLSRNQDS